MPSVILQPCGDSDANKHFIDTIQRPVLRRMINDHLSEQQKALVMPLLSGREAIPVWGVTPGKREVNVGKWKRIAVGDVALFSREGRIFATSTVAQKLHNKQLALALWDTNADGQTWEYIYFLDEITYVDIPYKRFNRVVGYKPEYVIQGFGVLDQEKSERILDAFDLRSDRYQAEEAISASAFEEAVGAALSGLEETDQKGIAAIRREQTYLRQHLFRGKVKERCSVCGEELPVDLLVASHIKKRSECSLKERLDFRHIVTPMCLLGCDALYERGYVVVNEKGIIAKGRVEVLSSDLKRHLEAIEGRKCDHWTNSSTPYFEWHRQRILGA
jgi:hypothetical protein